MKRILIDMFYAYLLLINVHTYATKPQTPESPRNGEKIMLNTTIEQDVRINLKKCASQVTRMELLTFLIAKNIISPAEQDKIHFINMVDGQELEVLKPNDMPGSIIRD